MSTLKSKNTKNIAGAVLMASTLSIGSFAFAQDQNQTDQAAGAAENVELDDGDSGGVFGDTLQGWRGTATLGATSSSGNSRASNVNGSIRLGKTINRWEHLVFGSVFKGNSTLVIDRTNADGTPVLTDDGRPERIIVKGANSDRLALGYQPKYYYTPKTYFFGILDWEQDKPANIDSATRQIIGLGHRFFANSTGFLSVEVGVGNKTTDPVDGEDIDGGVGYLGLNFLNRVTENVTFNLDMRSDFGSDNTFVELGVGVSFKLSEKLALKVDHFSRSNSDLDSGDNPLSSSSDSVTTLNLVIDI